MTSQARSNNMSSLQKKTMELNGAKNSKLENMEISDKSRSTNPRCRSQVWQHFGF